MPPLFNVIPRIVEEAAAKLGPEAGDLAAKLAQQGVPEAEIAARLASTQHGVPDSLLPEQGAMKASKPLFDGEGVFADTNVSPREELPGSHPSAWSDAGDLADTRISDMNG